MKKITNKTILLISLLMACTTFIVGVYMGKSGIATRIYKTFNPGPPKQTSINYIDSLDKDGLINRIRINNLQDAEIFRNKLISIIWGKDGIPFNSLPEKVETNIQDSLFSDIENLGSVDCIIDSLDHGFVSVMYHLKPKTNDKNEIVIYHHGHEGRNDYSAGIPSYKELVKNGYHVISIQMPLLGRNNLPEVNTPTTGKTQIRNHDMMMYLENPYPIFFTPIRTAINYLRKEKQYNGFSMLGLSGGGWTTQLYVAMDTTIKKSYTIAGSAPIEIKLIRFQDLGDMEQYDPRIYSQISYPEIYVLGSIGQGRRRIQILNTEDPCCFKYQNSIYYREAVTKKVEQIGIGTYQLLEDKTNKEHSISPFAITLVLKDLQNND